MMTFARSSVMSPPPIMRVELGEDRLDLLLGVHAFDDQRKIEGQPEHLLVWIPALAPKPMMPRSTVAPANPRSRSRSTMAS